MTRYALATSIENLETRLREGTELFVKHSEAMDALEEHRKVITVSKLRTFQVDMMSISEEF